uniref:Oxoglutarate dehydrogenase L n=1 Tax=Electrophorus electricus TaxID=8005 RepID=A0AAY5ETQ9_ELEEL
MKLFTEKCFGLESCEVLIPVAKMIIDKSSEAGTKSVIMGMPHSRGRMKVLTNVVWKDLDQIFCQFDPKLEAADKHHLGMYHEWLNRKMDKNMANPSYLEAVYLAVQGKSKAKQFYRGDLTGNKIAAGIVYETVHLSELPLYSTHLVNAPIFHGIADDPEAVMHVCRVVAELRNTFNKDVAINQMSTVKSVKQTELPIPQGGSMYADKLISGGVVTLLEFKDCFFEAYTSSKDEEILHICHWLDSTWRSTIVDPLVSHTAASSVPLQDFFIHSGECGERNLQVSTPPCGSLLNHRHHVLHVHSLSEYVVWLCFAMASLNALVCWEVQFGDFHNMAQGTIDQFISSTSSLLPNHHLINYNYGPEHSSAQPERFLQMSKDDPDFPWARQTLRSNWIMVICSTPANYFHVLRSQILLSFRNPEREHVSCLLPEARGSIIISSRGTKFRTIRPDESSASKNPNVVKRDIFFHIRTLLILIIFSYIYIFRYHHFPFILSGQNQQTYSNTESIWCQEEHKNMMLSNEKPIWLMSSFITIHILQELKIDYSVIFTSTADIKQMAQ